MTNERSQEIADKLEVLKTAYSLKQIAIHPVLTYKKKPAPAGFVFIRINYTSENTVVYDGAFILKETAKEKLGDNLHKFMLIQLATQL